jgi:hypothetical protein
VATPNERGSARPLRVYICGLRGVFRGSWQVNEVVVVALPKRSLGAFEDPRLPRSFALRPPAGFEVMERRRTEDFLLVRYRSPRPRRVTVTELSGVALDDGQAARLVTRSALK